MQQGVNTWTRFTSAQPDPYLIRPLLVVEDNVIITPVMFSTYINVMSSALVSILIFQLHTSNEAFTFPGC